MPSDRGPLHGQSESGECTCRDGRDSCGYCPDNRADLILQRGAGAVLRMAMAARGLYEEGIVCECENPLLCGRDLMCARCLRENQGQRDAREAWIRGPHPFEPGKVGFCKVCVHLEEDPRHV